MLPGGLVSGGGGRGGRLCLLRWLGLRLWSRRGTLVFALLWFGSWLFLNGLVLVHRSIMSDYCTDDKSKRILQRLSHMVGSFIHEELRLNESFFSVWPQEHVGGDTNFTSVTNVLMKTSKS
ncbi:hypothetical protein F2P81_019702 [Scophthalmus maximus]|uniref:Uncharacterized protein n=1 Tax=Scophthalmus maximus TaxID=52904 RepID=A0A6A4S8J2_SCOMX|nr:hypothetical protein F2P81_019702 [Scophthalmus maximus]